VQGVARKKDPLRQEKKVDGKDNARTAQVGGKIAREGSAIFYFSPLRRRVDSHRERRGISSGIRRRRGDKERGKVAAEKKLAVGRGDAR